MSLPTPTIKTVVAPSRHESLDWARAAEDANAKITVSNLDFFYGKTQALHGIS